MKNNSLHKVMSVGQCNPDHSTLKNFFERKFDCEITRIDTTQEALIELKKSKYDLVLVNRKIDADYTDGIILIQEMKREQSISDIPVMMISNYPEAQEESIQNGGTLGFGKLEYGKEETMEKLKKILKV
ncbi:MAG: response regulator [Leptospiraceae bacterium]|nr:response regulator [Leptospiraceae bacterium]